MSLDSIFKRLLRSLPDGRVAKVHIGLYWTAVAVEVDGDTRCGLAATRGDESHYFTNEPAIPQAGHLLDLRARELAELAYSTVLPLRSIGIAALNALIPPARERWVNRHSKELLARLGAGKKVAMVGHFPYADDLRRQVKELWVLEQNPREGDLPASAAAEVIPQADVLAVTAMTLVNNTFDELMALKPPGIPALVVGPSTPLSSVLFETGATILSGAVVEDIEAVLNGVSQGANFHQLRQLGARLVSMAADPEFTQSNLGRRRET